MRELGTIGGRTMKKIPYILWFILVAPWTYLIIEVIIIEMKWGLGALNNYSTIPTILILLAVVLIPCLCGLVMNKIIDMFGYALVGVENE